MKWIVIGWFDDTICQVYAHAPSLKEAKKLRLDAIELENYQIRQYTKVIIVCDPVEFLGKAKKDDCGYFTYPPHYSGMFYECLHDKRKIIHNPIMCNICRKKKGQVEISQKLIDWYYKTQKLRRARTR